jgi:hypothetical protein
VIKIVRTLGLIWLLWGTVVLGWLVACGITVLGWLITCGVAALWRLVRSRVWWLVRSTVLLRRPIVPGHVMLIVGRTWLL